MDHAKFQQRLNQVLDDRQQLHADDELLQMAAQSSECAERLAVAQTLLDGVDLLDCPTVRPALAERVVAAVSVNRQPSDLLRLWVPLCVAAALLLAAVPMYRFWQGADGENPVAEGKPLPENDEKTSPQPEKPHDTEHLIVVADSRVYIHRAGEAIGEAIWVRSMDQLTPEQEEWVKRATEEIRPVADPMATSVAMTVDAVVRTITPTIPRP